MPFSNTTRSGSGGVNSTGLNVICLGSFNIKFPAQAFSTEREGMTITVRIKHPRFTVKPRFTSPHRATSCCGAVATCLSPAFFTNVATVRFDFVKYSVATRWISAGVTAAILSRDFNA